MIKSIKSLISAITVSLFAATSLFSAECIAPANPGGGWDFTCRSISKIMTDIGAHDRSIKVTNMAGGGGGLGGSGTAGAGPALGAGGSGGGGAFSHSANPQSGGSGGGQPPPRGR